jgi:hypothetical protein
VVGGLREEFPEECCFPGPPGPGQNQRRKGAEGAEELIFD